MDTVFQAEESLLLCNSHTLIVLQNTNQRKMWMADRSEARQNAGRGQKVISDKRQLQVDSYRVC